ncbi:hypothetical protein MIR68_011922 [Amoeboaphelidium protococcarum]|nr:hypothetical protein MIR68_011922 [Amoeboaphelidium protococcarum]
MENKKYTITLQCGNDDCMYYQATLTIESFYSTVEVISLSESSQPLIRILHTNLSVVLRQEECTLAIRCKSMERFCLKFQTDNDLNEAYHKYNALLSMQNQIGRQYVHLYKQVHQSNFDQKMFKLGDSKMTSDYNPQKFRQSLVNSQFEVSSCLPSSLIVPASVEDDQLKQASEFRQHGKVPHIVYAHPHSQAVLSRSSQPLSGAKNRRSVADEHYLSVLLQSRRYEDGSNSSSSNSNDQLSIIVDCRSKQGISQSKLKYGGGSEADGNYPNINFYYGNIDGLQNGQNV